MTEIVTAIIDKQSPFFPVIIALSDEPAQIGVMSSRYLKQTPPPKFCLEINDFLAQASSKFPLRIPSTCEGLTDLTNRTYRQRLADGLESPYLIIFDGGKGMQVNLLPSDTRDEASYQLDKKRGVPQRWLPVFPTYCRLRQLGLHESARPIIPTEIIPVTLSNMLGGLPDKLWLPKSRVKLIDRKDIEVKF